MTGAAELLQRVRTPDAPLPGDDLAAVACTTELASVLHISPIAAPAALAQTLAIATHYPLDRKQTMTTTPAPANHQVDQGRRVMESTMRASLALIDGGIPPAAVLIGLLGAVSEIGARTIGPRELRRLLMQAADANTDSVE